MKYVRATAVFIGALVAEAVVFGFYLFSDIGFLWYNVIGCIVVICVGIILELIQPKKGIQDLTQ